MFTANLLSFCSGIISGRRAEIYIGEPSTENPVPGTQNLITLVYLLSCLPRREPATIRDLSHKKHSDCTGSLITRRSSRVTLVYFLSFILYLVPLSGSGAYDHGTSTGKGKLELDLTWNPFGIFIDGQTYVVLGYGLSDRLDFHGYFAHHEYSGLDNYYYGIFYQFLRTKYVDLATALGIRQFRQKNSIDLFLPQLLYNIRIISGYTLGGSIVDIRTIKKHPLGRSGTALDIALFIPITNYISVPNWVEEVKLGVGIFRPGSYKPLGREILPTYSIDVKLNWKKKGNTQKE